MLAIEMRARLPETSQTPCRRERKRFQRKASAEAPHSAVMSAVCRVLSGGPLSTKCLKDQAASLLGKKSCPEEKGREHNPNAKIEKWEVGGGRRRRGGRGGCC